MQRRVREARGGAGRRTRVPPLILLIGADAPYTSGTGGKCVPTDVPPPVDAPSGARIS